MDITPQVEREILTNIHSFISHFPDSAEALRQHLAPNTLPDVETLKRNIEIRLEQLEPPPPDLEPPYHLH